MLQGYCKIFHSCEISNVLRKFSISQPAKFSQVEKFLGLFPRPPSYKNLTKTTKIKTEKIKKNAED